MVLQDVLHRLEGDVDSLRGSLLSSDRQRWQGLQAAVALRNLLASADYLRHLQVGSSMDSLVEHGRVGSFQLPPAFLRCCCLMTCKE